MNILWEILKEIFQDSRRRNLPPVRRPKREFARHPAPERAMPVRVSMPTGDKTVLLDNTPLHSKQGWSVSGNVAEGHYRTRYGAWRGIIEQRGDKFYVYIFKPPVKQLEMHERWLCFYDKGRGKWEINLALNPKDGSIDAIIFYVEKVICESFAMGPL